MTDEKAIEYLKTRLSLLRRNYQFATEQAIETLLNLVEKQQEEIETLKRDFEIVDHECSRLEQEDIRKDIIIDLMAEQLTTPVHNKEWVIDYYKRKVE